MSGQGQGLTWHAVRLVGHNVCLENIFFLFRVITEEPSQHIRSDSVFASQNPQICQTNVRCPALICRLASEIPSMVGVRILTFCNGIMSSKPLLVVHTIYVVFHSCWFYDFPWVLIMDARSFQALAAILDYVTHSASISCWYRLDARQDEFRL